MAENSNIEWTDHTFNPVVGCKKVGPGCDHCYAESWAKRAGNPELWNGARRRTTEANWRKPLKWNREHDQFFAQHGRRQRVFCASLADVFDNEWDPQWRADLFHLIRKTQNLDWLLLTKRIGNAFAMSQRAMWDSGMHGGMHHSLPDNVWLGATIVNQAEADRDIPKLLEVPAAVRFLSMEPLLESVKIDLIPRPSWFDNLNDCICPLNLGIDWVIVGGESGGHARPFTLGHAKDIVRQCKSAGVPVFVKQMGDRPVNREGAPCLHIKARHGRDMAEWPEELRVREFPC